MRFTPNHNWPVAEDADVVKQYPAAVDQPFKDGLDLLVPTMVDVDHIESVLNLPGLSLRFGSNVPNVAADGIATVPFMNPFPTACVYVIPTLGDFTGPFIVIARHAESTPSSFRVGVYSANGGPPGVGVVRVNYVAVGY